MANSTKYNIEARSNNGLYYQWENFANYMNTFGKHTVGAMAGMSFTKNHWDNNTILQKAMIFFLPMSPTSATSTTCWLMPPRAWAMLRVMLPSFLTSDV